MFTRKNIISFLVSFALIFGVSLIVPQFFGESICREFLCWSGAVVIASVGAFLMVYIVDRFPPPEDNQL
jgi:cytosine/uracil/thiamine/allantoin permease